MRFGFATGASRRCGYGERKADWWLALSRKFIILDIVETAAATIAALAGSTLVLGIVYWLLRERDDRVVGPDRAPAAPED